MNLQPYFDAAQQAAEQHVEACEEALGEECVSEQLPDSPASGLYDGCLTCQVREALAAAWPHLLDAARAQVQSELEAAS